VATQRTPEISGLGMVALPNETNVRCYSDLDWTKIVLAMPWLYADTKRSSYSYQLTDYYTFWEFTQYSKFSSKMREEYYA